jgi:hypothetical protein
MWQISNQITVMELEKFAKDLGASKSSAGGLYDFVRDVANGELQS